MGEHLLHGHRQGSLVPVENVAGRIADDYGLNPCGLNDSRGGKIVGGQYHNLFPPGLHFYKSLGGNCFHDAYLSAV